jgi:hypothetical protein
MRGGGRVGGWRRGGGRRGRVGGGRWGSPGHGTPLPSHTEGGKAHGTPPALHLGGRHGHGMGRRKGTAMGGKETRRMGLRRWLTALRCRPPADHDHGTTRSPHQGESTSASTGRRRGATAGGVETRIRGRRWLTALRCLPPASYAPPPTKRGQRRMALRRPRQCCIAMSREGTPHRYHRRLAVPCRYHWPSAARTPFVQYRRGDLPSQLRHRRAPMPEPPL